ncbi:sulfonate transport system substrate-binding protein [Mesorhizobium albiziae]|uniref:Putative aliphatic sulfonates-binding protein n=1 Tax=Neomesorhizobium albiziae TaxID=335020 RepID=A0A1I4D2F5_9HYPH|nr:ABC transporter substrate-binding protein [Mesorhizobium albiziae]GLS28331.1 ABC transporter substrate-binding protein [Mesorhizobium albiziae]SFK87335.1 sulfonate transport system substrate-binding protein [Mesorhizobium albiziae]
MKMLSRRVFNLLFAGFAVATAFGSVPSAFAAEDLNKVVLRVGDQTGATRAKLEAAGLLDDVPYRIEWSVFAAAVNLHEALKADAVDIGSAADSPTVSAIAGGSKIKIVASWSNGGRGSSLIIPADSPIKTIQDLKGKTISPTTRGSVAHYLVLGVLKKAGLGQDDVKLAFLNPSDASAAFQAGSIDAWGTWGIYKARSIGTLKATVLIDGPGINTGNGVLSATDNALSDPAKVAAIADFSARIDRAYKWSKDNKDAYVAFYAAFTKQDKATVESLYADEAAFERTPIDHAFTASLQNVFETWKEAGVLSGDLKLADFVYRDLPTN